MTKQEIYNEIKQRKIKTAEILDKLALEKRNATHVEDITLESYKAEIEQLEAEARGIDTTNEKKRIITSTASYGEDIFTLTSFLRNLKSNRFNDVEQEVIARGRELFAGTSTSYVGTPMPLEFSRATLAAKTTGVGSELVSTEKFDLLMPLRANSVLAKAGATILTNLKGNIEIPAMTGSTAAWKGETIAAADGVNGFKTVSYSPKKLTVYLPVSNLLLIQNSVSAEEKLKQDLVNAINDKLEATLLGTASGNTVQPAGIFYGASYLNGGIQVTGASSTNGWAKIVALETGVKSNNSDGNVYLVHPTTLGSLKTNPKVANTGLFIAEGATINGYKYLSTTNMPTINTTGKGVLFGNFADFYVNFWNGATDVIVDQITGAKDGVTNFIFTIYVDGGAVRSTSFAKGWLS